jgi:hypothetical protein
MMLFLWVLASCRLVGRRQRFGEKYRLHLQGFSLLPTSLHGAKTRNINIFNPDDGDSTFLRNVWHLPTSLHDPKTHKIIIIIIFIAVKTSNLTRSFHVFLLVRSCKRLGSTKDKLRPLPFETCNFVFMLFVIRSCRRFIAQLRKRRLIEVSFIY